MDTYYFGKRKRGERGGAMGSGSTSRSASSQDSSSLLLLQRKTSFLHHQEQQEQPKPFDSVSCAGGSDGTDIVEDCAAVATLTPPSSSIASWTAEVSAATAAASGVAQDDNDDDDEGYAPSVENSSCTYPFSSSGDEMGGDEMASSCASTTDDDDYEVYASLVNRRTVTKKSRQNDSRSITARVVNGLPGDRSPFMALGSDIMASVVSFLEPADTLRLLTMPLCREWRQSYTAHQDLWRSLCRMEPFSADLGTKSDGYTTASDDDDGSFSDDDDSFCSLGGGDIDDYSTLLDGKAKGGDEGDVLGEYRLLYTSFVRCLNYLGRIQDDAQNGRTPSVMDYGTNYSQFPTFGVTKSLKKFLAKKKHTSLKSVIGDGGTSSFRRNVSSMPIGVLSDGSLTKQFGTAAAAAKPSCAHDTLEDSSKKPKYGQSMITQRLLGPTATGAPSHLNLPTSCAIYSIVNWMVAHPDVEGIQTMCICSLPVLLEDENQRLTAQGVGLVEVLLRGMLRFPMSAKLHIAAFHTMVLLARPLGGREGMLFDNSMKDSARSLGLTAAAHYGRFSSSSDRSQQSPYARSMSSDPRESSTMNGTSILIDSMKRFESNEKLQAMACWAMVNLALVPTQKTMLISLNGIESTVNAMKKHPKSFEVQFRALFALINLVVPSKTPVRLPSASNAVAPTLDTVPRTEKDVLDEWAPQIAKLVVEAMETFCSSETILNRACLVLHNLSQSPDFISTLLWTPHCYQMLEWCIANHSTDHVLRRSASSTLNRIQVHLSQHEDERRRFVQSIQREQQQQQQQQQQIQQGQIPEVPSHP